MVTIKMYSSLATNVSFTNILDIVCKRCPSSSAHKYVFFVCTKTYGDVRKCINCSQCDAVNYSQCSLAVHTEL